MPNYGYRCQDCQRKFEVFQSYQEYGRQPVTCPHCGSDHVQRKFNRVRVARGDHGRLEDLADPSRLEGIDEVVDRLERGQSPEDIERDLPDLGSDDAL